MAELDAINYFNRYTGRVEQERIYGDAWLRWTYGNSFGRLALELFVKRPLFSRWYGWRMNRPGSRRKVLPFIRTYGLDISEFADPPESFRSFNEFFHRRLKPSSRPAAADGDAVLFPADGRHLGFPDASRIDGVFVKGQRFDLTPLLGDAQLAAHYARGTVVLSRLCPVDYHRFHFPLAGLPAESKQLDGLLYSVNPIALRKNLGYLWRNRRVLTILQTEKSGQVIMLEIGATNVGSIVQTYRPGAPVFRAQEKGYFRFGGSSIVLLFEPGRVRLADDMVRQTEQRIELYARMGDQLGTIV